MVYCCQYLEPTEQKNLSQKICSCDDPIVAAAGLWYLKHWSWIEDVLGGHPGSRQIKQTEEGLKVAFRVFYGTQKAEVF